MGFNRSDILAGKATVGMELDQTGFKRGLTDVDNRLNKFQAQMYRSGNAIKSVGYSFLKFGATAGIGFGLAIREGIKFEDQMARVRAITNATNNDFARLSATARSMGGSTTFTATQVAEGMEALGRTGYNATESISAIPEVLALARVGVLELGQSADIVAGVAKAFGLTADEAGRVADVIGVMASSSAVNVDGLGESFKFVATQSSLLGQSIESTSVYLGLLGDKLNRGGMAGRNFARMLTKLQSANVRDSLKDQFDVDVINPYTGKLRDILDIVKDLKTATKSMNSLDVGDTFKDLFDTQGARALQTAMTASVDRIDELTNKASNARGQIIAMQKIMENTLGGSIKLLTSAFAELGIAIKTSLNDELKSTVKYLTESAISIGKWVKENKQAVIVIASVVSGITAMGVALLGLGVGIKLIGVMSIGFGLLDTAVIAHTTKVFAMASAYIASARAQALAMGMYTKNYVLYGEVVADAFTRFGTGTGVAVKNVGLLTRVFGKLGKVFSFIKPLITFIGAGLRLIVGTISAIGGVSFAIILGGLTAVWDIIQNIRGKGSMWDNVWGIGSMRKWISEAIYGFGDLDAQMEKVLKRSKKTVFLVDRQNVKRSQGIIETLRQQIENAEKRGSNVELDRLKTEIMKERENLRKLQAQSYDSFNEVSKSRKTVLIRKKAKEMLKSYPSQGNFNGSKTANSALEAIRKWNDGVKGSGNILQEHALILINNLKFTKSMMKNLKERDAIERKIIREKRKELNRVLNDFGAKLDKVKSYNKNSGNVSDYYKGLDQAQSMGLDTDIFKQLSGGVEYQLNLAFSKLGTGMQGLAVSAEKARFSRGTTIKGGNESETAQNVNKWLERLNSTLVGKKVLGGLQSGSMTGASGVPWGELLNVARNEKRALVTELNTLKEQMSVTQQGTSNDAERNALLNQLNAKQREVDALNNIKIEGYTDKKDGVGDSISSVVEGSFSALGVGAGSPAIKAQDKTTKAIRQMDTNVTKAVEKVATNNTAIFG